MAHVLIIGASRGIGLETVRLALESGHQVSALARSADDIAITHADLEKLNGSALEKSDVENAIEGCDVVITALGASPTLQPVRLFSTSMGLVIDAMQRHEVRRLIAVTGMGAGDTRGLGGLLYAKLLQPLLLGPIYQDKDREEAIIRQSDLDWTIVRPGFLTRFPRTGKYRALTDPSQWESGFISRANVADFLVQQINDKTYFRQSPLLIE